MRTDFADGKLKASDGSVVMLLFSKWISMFAAKGKFDRPEEIDVI